ncbi:MULTISPECIES: glycosyltransferase [Micromonospora]|uniref:glycosyltransferase n=1 Tax=Micromonospora TaxID=1873 RepID=UPI000D6F7C31|nr:glycosyltransferase [Micromonospora sp. S4605]PWU50035.1 hypothetical protein DLJ47_24835 [Micromonospora sp. S4605]
MDTLNDEIRTDRWRLRAPAAARLGRTVCIPTVHPTGDQRVLRCAQSALDAGYDIDLIWLGGGSAHGHPHPRVRETRLPEVRSIRHRLELVPTVVRLAESRAADAWHIHDFYLLRAACAWSRRTGRPVLYDVHEYYPEYYSHRLPGPPWMRGQARRLIAGLERHYASKVAGVNAVSDRIASRLAATGVPAVATPNFPSEEALGDQHRPLVAALLKRVVHTGSLTPEFGSDVLLSVAHELARQAPEVELVVVRRFPSESARAAFSELLQRRGTPPNLTLVDPLPAHELSRLLASCGIGISFLQDVGQASLCVSTKLYEYVTVGLAIVASDLTGAREFIEASAAGVLVDPRRPSAYVQAILRTLDDADRTCAAVNAAAAAARERMSWEKACAPALQALMRQVVG